MMMEQHYDEEVLAGFLAEPIDSATRDKHLSSCALCQRTLDSLRGTASLLKEADVWQPSSFSATPRRETLHFLRDVQKTMGDEDAAANVYIKHLLAGPRETWAAKLEKHPEWRTAGVVRKLIAATDRYNFSAPLDALELTRLTASIADSLAPGVMRDSLVADAWREHAYALLIVGSYTESMAAVTRAESATATGLAFARTSLMRALILRGMENWTEAAAMARSAADDFLQYGDTARYFSARMAEAGVWYDNSQYRQAIDIYAELAALHRQMPEQTIALAHHNEGLCHRELGEFQRAETCFVKAIDICDRHQMNMLRAKAHWHLARVLMRQAKHEAALKILDRLRAEFEELGMSDDLACVSIDMAEALLAVGRSQEVAALCRHAIDYFRVAGLAYSTGAMTALAYLQEAAVKGRLTVSDLVEVRGFLERLPQKPNVVFARSFS
jgi:tetratricopeptide (TPR) repeat protein